MELLGKKKKWWFIISGLVILPGIISLFLWGLPSGIDFKGGTLLELEFQKNLSLSEIRQTLNPLNLPDLQVALTGSNTVLLKMAPAEKEKIEEVKKLLGEKIGQAKEIRYETVGPTIGKDLKRKAIWAVVLACFGIIFYIAWAFRSVPKPQSSFKFGLCAVFALIHDVLVVLGTFSILSHFFAWEVDAYFITALLTVMGFSVHDTIVVFDRIRENLKREAGLRFEQIANDSVVQTLARSINTSLTVILTLLALLLLGGETIKPFISALLVGITTGTYSSIFNATPLLVIWQKKE